jgi:hypothetical protein
MDLFHTLSARIDGYVRQVASANVHEWKCYISRATRDACRLLDSMPRSAVRSGRWRDHVERHGLRSPDDVLAEIQSRNETAWSHVRVEPGHAALDRARAAYLRRIGNAAPTQTATRPANGLDKR